MHIISKVKETIEKWNLLSKKDRILVAVSGGKDSAGVLYILKKLGYNVEALHLQLGVGVWSEKCLEAVQELCKKLDVKLHIFDIKKTFGTSMCYLRNVVQSKQKLRNCHVCGVLKRQLINKLARKLKATKLVTGHNLDDEAQTILMNFLLGNLEVAKRIGPISGLIKDKKFVPRVKPLYFCSEKDILKFALAKKLPFVKEACPCSADAFRRKIKEWLDHFSDKEKMKFVRFFLKKIKPKLEKKDFELKYCTICNEPTAKEICKVCSLFKDVFEKVEKCMVA